MLYFEDLDFGRVIYILKILYWDNNKEGNCSNKKVDQ